MASSGDQLPGRGLLGWLGRQIGYVKRAAKADVKTEPLYRSEVVEEQAHPADPGITLRRTTIDEAILTKRSEEK